MTAAILLLAAGLQAPAPPAVEGVVRSSQGGEPIPYAQVRVVGDTAADWTDAHGRYRLQGLEPGSWHVRVVHTAHDSLDLEVLVPADRSLRLDVTLEARPSVTEDALADFEPFHVEYTLPALMNSQEVLAMIQDRYPPDLMDQGIGGEAVLRLWLDERGQVVRSLVASSSGAAALDSIALEVSDRMRFRPAMNRDQAVRVIVRIPVFFTVPDSLQGG